MQEARYVFGVAEVGAASGVACAGFGDEPVRLVGRGKLRAAVQRCQPDFLAGQPEAAVAEAVRIHHRVLQRLWAQTETLIPARFGTLVAGDDEAAAAWLDGARAALQPVLQSLRGRCEVAVAISRREPGSDPDGASQSLRPSATGTAFLLQRLQAQRAAAEEIRAANALRQELIAALAPLPLAIRLETPRGQGMVARFSCLLYRRHLSDFEHQVRETAGRLGLVVTQCEALPPYSFVAQTATAEAPHSGR